MACRIFRHRHPQLQVIGENISTPLIQMGIFAKATGVVIIGFLGVTGGLLRISEYIPDNAQIWVYPSQQTWSPDSWFMDRDFEEGLQDSERRDDMQRWMNDRHRASYSDVKEGARYFGYEAFPVLLEEPGNIMRGWNGSLLMSWFFRDPRWSDEGT